MPVILEKIRDDLDEFERSGSESLYSGSFVAFSELVSVERTTTNKKNDKACYG